jgi:DNA topoisomerase-3
VIPFIRVIHIHTIHPLHARFAKIFGAPISETTTRSRPRICEHLQQCAKGCHHLVLWLDCDREGENICFEVMDNTVRWLQHAPGKQVYRAKFSAVCTSPVVDALAMLL